MQGEAFFFFQEAAVPLPPELLATDATKPELSIPHFSIFYLFFGGPGQILGLHRPKVVNDILGHSIHTVLDVNECIRPICIVSTEFRGHSKKFVELDRPRL